jgi:superfamily II DNA helicase RecQ
LNLLKKFLNNLTAEFKIDEQKLLLKTILLKIPYILKILPTSAGKSLIYLLLAALNNAKTTIVIVSLISLKSNLIQRAFEFNILCNTYKNNPIFTNLTLISIKTITS